MHIAVSCQAFAQSLSLVAGIVPNAHANPAYESVKLEVDSTGDAAQLIGSDGESTIIQTLSGITSASAGAALLPLKKLSAIVRESSGDLNFRIEKNLIVVESTHSRFELAAADVGEYPPVDVLKTEPGTITVSAETLVEMFSRIIFACDTKSTRYALSGAIFQFGGSSPSANILELAATDSRRLSICHTGCQVKGDPLKANAKPVVPVKALRLLHRGLSEGDCDISFSENMARFTCGPTTVITRLTEGRYPHYPDIVPKKFQHEFTTQIGALLSAVRQSAIMTSQESRGVDFTIGENNLRLEAKAAEVGEAHIDLPVSGTGSGEPFTLDPRYLIDFLNALPAEESIAVKLVDEESAITLLYKTETTYLLMPLARDRV